MSLLSEILAANRVYASTFREKGRLPKAPKRKVAVLTCMDARLDPAKFLGLEEGDAHVIRNAGGRASADAIRSLVISSELQGTREFVVVHHTDCGMLTFSNEQLRDRLQRKLGVDAAEVDFLPFSNLEESVRDDVQSIRSSPLIPKEIPVTGFVYEVTTGKLQKVS
jgi:carbonic anhydrase